MRIIFMKQNNTIQDGVTVRLISHILGDKDLLSKAFHLLCQLRPHLSFEQFQEFYQTMRCAVQYDAFLLIKDNQVIGFASFEIQTRFSFGGKFLYIADLVIDKGQQSKGYGQMLMQKIHDFAEQHQLLKIVLESGLSRIQAHIFYEKLGYQKESYSFRK